MLEAGLDFSLPHNPILSFAEANNCQEREKVEGGRKNIFGLFYVFLFSISKKLPVALYDLKLYLQSLIYFKWSNLIKKST